MIEKIWEHHENQRTRIIIISKFYKFISTGRKMAFFCTLRVKGYSGQVGVMGLNYSQRFSHEMHVIHGSSIIFDKLKFLLYKRYKLRAQQFQIWTFNRWLNQMFSIKTVYHRFYNWYSNPWEYLSSQKCKFCSSVKNICGWCSMYCRRTWQPHRGAPMM